MPIISVGGVDLHYIQAGAGDDILLLCGLGDDVTAWAEQTMAFAEHYRVTVIDNRGVGRSSLPDGEFTVVEMASDAAGRCDALGIRQAHVMGLSTGGAIAQELVIARPELVRSLVIVGSWCYSDRLFRAKGARPQTTIGGDTAVVASRPDPGGCALESRSIRWV